MIRETLTDPRLAWLITVFAGLFGAVIGSFLNVCIYRIPLGRSVVSPGSACPACGTAIRAWQNVPVVSWLLLRGKCASCRAPISIRYPLIEAANAALWVGAFLRYGVTLQAVVLLPLLSALLVLFFTDWDHFLLPDRVTFPLAIAGLALAPWNARLDLAPSWFGGGTVWSRLGAAVLGAAVGFGTFFAISLTWKVFFKRDAIGGGDLKLMLGVGAFLGLPGDFLTIFVGSLVGALLSLPFLLKGDWSMRRELPFGCFLCPAAMLCAFWGNEFVTWYLGLLA